MISSNNDPDYVFEEYKGYTIASHKNNVSGKDIDNLIMVYRPNEFPNYGFFIGLDDSKLSGRRKFVPHNMDDAKAYIDWVVDIRQEQHENIPEQPEPKIGKGR